jgi:hypothetical protein
VGIEEVLRIGDEATQTTVLRDLYESMKDSPASPDLAGLWKRLGIRGEGANVAFDNQAPLAALRVSMTASPR